MRKKKGQGVQFKVTPKTEIDTAQVQELQMKKKILEERFSKFYL